MASLYASTLKQPMQCGRLCDHYHYQLVSTGSTFWRQELMLKAFREESADVLGAS